MKTRGESSDCVFNFFRLPSALISMDLVPPSTLSLLTGLKYLTLIRHAANLLFLLLDCLGSFFLPLFQLALLVSEFVSPFTLGKAMAYISTESFKANLGGTDLWRPLKNLMLLGLHSSYTNPKYVTQSLLGRGVIKKSVFGVNIRPILISDHLANCEILSFSLTFMSRMKTSF